jgi:hypothetical protein
MRIQVGRIVAFHNLFEKDARQPATVLAANNNPANAERTRHRTFLFRKPERKSSGGLPVSGESVNPTFIAQPQD